jgi:AcrR family transcriptional regulator
MGDITIAAPVGGLRERKKRETRDTIARVALELFDRQGFQHTTIAEIAAAADVSPRTVSSYFPAKEELAFADTADAFARLGAHLDARAPGETTAEALRAWITGELPDWDSRDEELRCHRRVVASSEALLSYEQHLRGEGQRLIAESIARDLGGSPDDLESRMAAAATMATFDVLGAHRDAEELTPEEDPALDEKRRAEALDLLDRALTFVGAGIRALQAAG